jgi:hypothetical protein
MRIGKWTSREWDYYYDEPGDILEIYYGFQFGEWFVGIRRTKTNILECTIADDDTVDMKTNMKRQRELRRIRREHTITGRWSAQTN